LVRNRLGQAVTSYRPARPVLLATGLILSVVLVVAGLVLIITPTSAAHRSAGPAGPAVSAGSASVPGRAPAGSASGSSQVPAGRLFAPYLANWGSESLASIARASGARYLRLAFLETARRGSCALAWQGNPSIAVTGSSLAAQVAQLQALGGGIIPSFGGFTAESNGTDIADSCPSVPAIAAAYESVVARYSPTWIDLTVEAAALTDQAGIERRGAALALLQQWASATGHQVKIMITFAGGPQGLNSGQLAVLQSLMAHGVRLSAVNLLAYDYFEAQKQPVDMAAAAIGGLEVLHEQLGRLYPGLSGARLWSMVAVTLMPGIDDNAAKTEITTPVDAAQILAFARRVGLAQVSIWSLDRDNGQCPGTAASSTCSGIAQASWAFSRLLEA
jgi:hypothetical protein